jgi:glycosyltransferase involved in cell wall biosynthesis
MNFPRVTICIPVFNGGQYFRSALESALKQDYENIEIIVVNDGSTDGGETERIALAHGDRVRYFYQPNTGVAGAINAAIAGMTGDFLAWLSHDDLHLPHKTAAQVAFLARLGRPRACLFSDFELIGPLDEPITTVRLPTERIRQNPRLPLYNGMISGSTLLIPIEVLSEFGPFDEALCYTQDYYVWNRILIRHEFFHQPEVLIRNRIHTGRGTNTPRAVSEGNELWKTMLDSRSEVERAQMFGSTRRYFASLATFLDATPYQEAAAHAQARHAALGAGALVSVVIPFWNNVKLVLQAVHSVVGQTHRNIEVVLVDAGSTEDMAALADFAATDPRVRLVHQAFSGPAAARNRALNMVQGDYIAFLDADDTFLPQKIERQLEQMQRHGALFSHTSFYVDNLGQIGFGLRRSGAFGGACYPQIIGGCPIAMSTVMLHRSLVDEGFAFPIDLRAGEDMLSWIDLTLRYTLLGIEEPLSIVGWSDGSAELDQSKQVLRLSGMVEALERHRVHSRHPAEIEKLRQTLRDLARNWVASGRRFEAGIT